MKKNLTQIGAMLCVAIICALLGACTQATNNAVVYGGGGSSVGVSGSPSTTTNFDGYPSVKGPGVSLQAAYQELSSKYNLTTAGSSGGLYYQEVGAGSGNPHVITFTLSPGEEVFVDNNGIPRYLKGCCNRICPVRNTAPQQAPSGGVVLNQTINQAPSFFNSLGEGLGAGFGLALGVSATEVTSNARQWDGGYRTYQPRRQQYQRRQEYYPPPRQPGKPREVYCPPRQQPPPPRPQPTPRPPVYCPPASPSQSVGRGGPSKVFGGGSGGSAGAHPRQRDPNGDR